MTNRSEDKMWRAVAACDPHYDGVFCYGVKTTRIFCRPSCKSRPPRRENVLYFPHHTDALAAGFRPCKRCRPDAPVFAPEEDAVRAARDLLEAEYATPSILAELPRRIGLSRSHLARLFKQYTCRTLQEYLHHIRVQKAQELLATSTLTGTRISYEVGFGSPGRFFAAFRARTGLSPRAWRQSSVKKEGTT